ncbi:MAG: PAN domain-containing protein [Rubrivivax sp.]|nr:PAN domain-containing protein [Rubrivivax sp.]
MSTDSPAAPSERTVKPPASAGAAVAGIARAPTTRGASQYVMEENTNRFGDDYTDLDLPAPDPALCAQACKDDAKCKAWTYVKPGVQVDGARCWLKDKVPPPSPEENCISGVNSQRR